MKLLFVVQTSPSDWFIIVFMSNFQEIRLKWSCSLCSICSGIINKLSKQTKMTTKAAAMSLVCVYVSCITPETCFVEKKIFCDFAKLIFVIVSDAIFFFSLRHKMIHFYFVIAFDSATEGTHFLVCKERTLLDLRFIYRRKYVKRLAHINIYHTGMHLGMY